MIPDTQGIRSKRTLEAIQQWQLTSAEPPVCAGVVFRAVCASSHLNFSAGALNTNLQEDPAEVMLFFFFLIEAGGTSGKEHACQCKSCKTCKLNHWVGRRARQPIPAFLPGESHGQRSLVGYSP